MATAATAIFIIGAETLFLYFFEAANRLAIKLDKFTDMKTKILIKNTVLFFVMILFAGLNFDCHAQDKSKVESQKSNEIHTGAQQTDKYLPLLTDKKVGVLTNQTGVIEFIATAGKGENELKQVNFFINVSIIDYLIKSKINVQKIYAPEHGFRGTADAGELIKDGKDAKTGLPIYSLYGNNKKPTKEQLAGIDVMLFDLQDVGVRFYTYISTLHYVMEACAENGISVIVLDKPNPNAHYIDGPILEGKWQSFVGMHPVPIVYGMTIGEYARMINGEKWLKDGIQCDLTVIVCENYTHQTPYELPIAPSPNLRTAAAIYLYPSLCLFEGTSVSVGRGTKTPFELYGHPNFPKTVFSFTPVSSYGAKDPLWKDKLCNGYLLSNDSSDLFQHHFQLKYLLQAQQLLAKANVPFITSANFFD